MATVDVNGITIAYEVRGSGEPFVWVGGTGVGGGVWREQVDFFEGFFTCVTFDLRGTGASSSPDEPYTVEVFARDLSQLLDHLQIESAHFAGFSLGSAIIQRLALDEPGRVKTATLISTWSSTRREEHIRLWFEARKRALEEGPREVFQGFAFWMFAPSVIDHEPAVVSRVQAMFAANSSAQPAHAYRRHFEADLAHDTYDELGSIRCPTLVVYGQEDLITLPWYNRAVAERIPDAVLREIPAAGHFLWLERPLELNAAIAEFLTDTGVLTGMGSATHAVD
jgi:pimeloyl-ACP methyl ester carboxylesterase